jgi:hypothetical protein
MLKEASLMIKPCLPDLRDISYPKKLSRELATWHCSDLAATLWRAYSG